MTIQERIQNDLKNAIKNKEMNKVRNLRVIIGELQRLEDKELSDKIVLDLLTSLGKKAKKNIEKYKYDVEGNKEFISIIEDYTGMKLLTTCVTINEIKKWINDNINSDELDRRSAMSATMKHFKGCANPKMVNEILGNIYG